MKNIGVCIVVTILLCLCVGLGNSINLPREPIYRDQIVECCLSYNSDILWFGYDLDEDGLIDYWTGRILIVTDTGLKAILLPTYYVVDFNRDGEFTKYEIFIDIYQDGINGNEMLDFKYEKKLEEKIGT